MRVGLDLLYLVPGETGGRETYVRELAPELLRGAPGLELVAFINRDTGPAIARELGESVRVVVVPVSARRHWQWAFGEIALVSAAARRARVDLLHCPANFAPAWGSVPRVVTIHDLHYKATPELLSVPMRVGTDVLVRLAAAGADRIITGSEVARAEIVSGLGVDRGRIDVVPHGLRRPPGNVSSALARERHRLGGRPVVLTVATNVPHKNLPSLIEAAALIASEERPTFVIAGHGTDDATLEAAVSSRGLAAHVRLLGRCSDDELESLYALASCLLLPTLHEGFGLPVIEAMARSVPVLCSDIPVLREVANEAAMFFDPRDPADIAAKVCGLLSDGRLVEQLRERGRVRAGAFSWSAAAQGTLASYRRALDGGTSHRSGR